jgi:hypothetical protein
MHVQLITMLRHKSIISYLEANNLSKASEALRAELGLDDAAFDASMTKKYETLLEKKWTSVIRLQKKVRLPQRGPFIAIRFYLNFADP